ncbi:hypothetical protein M0R04_10895 [Candidatus Dojkabacteria bacterium]|jgi:hypothetical protein|nr:hypothetical protein [Candidatus Dojkabacteria bacterium]
MAGDISRKNGELGGRPKGESPVTKLKKKLKQHFRDDEIDDLIASAKVKAETSDKMLMFLLEHIFGKARQNIGLDGGEDNEPIKMDMTVDEAINKIYGSKGSDSK